MEKLINIGDQQFYYATIEQLINECFQGGTCAIIVDKLHLEELLIQGVSLIGRCVSQLIIISDNVNVALGELENKDVLLLSAATLKEGIGLAMLSSDLNKHIVCIPKEDINEAKNIVELLSV